MKTQIEMRRPTTTEYELVEGTIKSKVQRGLLSTLLISLLICVEVIFVFYLRGLSAYAVIIGAALILFFNIYYLFVYLSDKRKRAKALSTGELEVVRATCVYKTKERATGLLNFLSNAYDLKLDFETELGSDLELKNPTRYGTIKPNVDCLIARINEDFIVISLME